MALIKGIIGTILSIVTFIIAVKIAAFLLALVGFALKLLWLAVMLGVICLVAYVAYRILVPRQAEQS